MTKPAEKIRLAEAADVNQLLDLELRCFTSDRFNKRQFAYLVKKASGFVLVYEIDKKINEHKRDLTDRINKEKGNKGS